MSIKDMFLESAETKRLALNLENPIRQSIDIIKKSIASNGKLLIAGNGGSAADAQHFAAELVGRYKMERKALPAIALTTDTSIITAWTNDYGFDSLFSRQIEALGAKGDVFIGISTSGNSKNILEAIDTAKKNGIYTIALLGKDGGKIKDIVDLSLVVPSDNTPRIQETHIMIIHIICEILEKELFDNCGEDK